MARRFVLILLTVAAVGSCGGSNTGAGPTAEPTSTSRVASADRTQPAIHVQLDYEDRTRPAVDPAESRSAPTRVLLTELYLPAGGGPHPLVVFAHGYNGDPSKFSELFTAWSDAGFAVLAPWFPITSTADPAGPIARAGDIAEQPADMSFVLDRLLAGEYGPRIDRARIATAGLSLGGGTVWGLTTDTCCREPRFRAAIVMDGNRFGFGAATFTPNRIPTLVFHADGDPALSYSAAREGFADLAAPKYFVTIFAAVHAQPFEDSPADSDPMVTTTTIDFLRAYVLDDEAARERIAEDATVPGVSELSESAPG